MLGYYFVLMGSLCLCAALVEAWLLVAMFLSEASAVSRFIPGRQELLKSHIDYLMMSQFLFIFFMLFRSFSLAPPVWLVACVCIGSFFNPLGFLIRAIKPGYIKQPPLPFTLMIAISFLLTTAGYAATAWIVAREALSGGLG
jgi:hypothetical protein